MNRRYVQQTQHIDFLSFFSIPFPNLCHAEANFMPAHSSAPMIFSLIIHKIRPTVS
jgi:hypothetical protein